MKDEAKIRLGAALRATRNIFADPDQTEHVFELIRALEGRTMHRVYTRLRQSASGRALLRERPSLLPKLCDRDWLYSLPEGSFGRTYLAFVESEGISADGLIEASEAHPPVYTDPELQWITDWLRDTHDLWHAALGYRGDLVGEAALLAFSYRHVDNKGLALIASLAWWKLGRITPANMRARQTIVEGWHLGGDTAWFVDVPWHQWLERPLSEVRQDLGIEAPVRYAPVRSNEVDTRLNVMPSRPSRFLSRSSPAA